MPRFARLLFAVALLALQAALPASAQDGGLPDAQEALRDRLREILRAVADYDSFVATSRQEILQDATLVLPSETRLSSGSFSLAREVRYTRDAGGTPNVQGMFTLATSRTGTDPLQRRVTNLTTEVRMVDGEVYFKGQLEVENVPGSRPLPDGWVHLTQPDEWPELAPLNLDRLLENPLDPALFEPELYALLEHASEIWSDAAEAGDLRRIAVRVADEDLVAAALASMGAAPDDSDEAFYGALAEGMYEITFDLDADGNLSAIRGESFLHWQDVDTRTFTFEDWPSHLYSQTTMTTYDVTLTAINAPLEPVAAPDLN